MGGSLNEDLTNPPPLEPNLTSIVNEENGLHEILSYFSKELGSPYTEEDLTILVNTYIEHKEERKSYEFYNSMVNYYNKHKEISSKIISLKEAIKKEMQNLEALSNSREDSIINRNNFLISIEGKKTYLNTYVEDERALLAITDEAILTYWSFFGMDIQEINNPQEHDYDFYDNVDNYGEEGLSFEVYSERPNVEEIKKSFIDDVIKGIVYSYTDFIQNPNFYGLSSNKENTLEDTMQMYLGIQARNMFSQNLDNVYEALINCRSQDELVDILLDFGVIDDYTCTALKHEMRTLRAYNIEKKDWFKDLCNKQNNIIKTLTI